MKTEHLQNRPLVQMTRKELATKLSDFLQTDQLETESDANKIAARFARRMKVLGLVTSDASDEASSADETEVA